MQDTPPFTNRLAAESSPYLLQHAHNPVDWFPWGDEAFARARDENKPVFLSIGYSACHWCHVMEHESFENPAIAQLLNDRFVSIKVDREERPDVDEIYMTAVQMITGSGGWPLSLFLLPDGRPFYGGTYFPPTSRYNRIGFPSLLTQLADAWVNRRGEIEESADSMVAELRKISGNSYPASGDAATVTPAALLDRVVADMAERFDAVNGGFGGAPKFPPHHALRLLTLAAKGGNESALSMLRSTLDRMAIGGIYDHVGGGFHRYATDAIWLLPHFEKMLYDNALLARVYAEAFALTGAPAYARIARETCDWMLRDLLDDRGGFQAALDADSEGEEGKYYVWTTAEVTALVGSAKAADWVNLYRFVPSGNFHDEASGKATGSNIPHLGAGEANAILLPRLSTDTEAIRAALLAQRYQRIPPGRDDKVITAWNGLAIGALALCGQRLGESRYVDAARAAAAFAVTTLRNDDDRLLRRYAKGVVGIDAFLDDYAFLADGLLDLFDVTGDPTYADAARRLTRVVLADFTDPAGGSFFYTGGQHEALIARTKDSFDGALPSANGVIARALVRLSALPGGEEFADAATRQRGAYAGLLTRAPEAVPTLVETELLAEAQMMGEKVNAKAVTLGVIGGSTIHLHPGEAATVRFQMAIAAGHHVNAYGSGESPTVATFASDAPATVGPLTYPPATAWIDPLGETINVYSGTVTIDLPVAITADAAPGRYSLQVRVRYQACNESSCTAPSDDSVDVILVVE